MSLEIEKNNNIKTFITYDSINPMLDTILEIDEDDESVENHFKEIRNNPELIDNLVIDQDCPICFDSLKDNDSIKLDCCNQIIHLKCIRDWYLKNPELKEDQQSICMMCRMESYTMREIYNEVKSNSIDIENNESIYSAEYVSNHSCDCSKCISYFLTMACMIFVFIILGNGFSHQEEEAEAENN